MANSNVNVNNVNWSSLQSQLAQMGYQLHLTSAVPGAAGSALGALNMNAAPVAPAPTLASAMALDPDLDDEGPRPPLSLNYGPRPDGTPGRGEFNLQTVLGLSKYEYSLIKRVMRRICIQCRLVMTKALRFQNKSRVRTVCARTLVAFPEFRDFDDPEWPLMALLYVIFKSGTDSQRREKKKAALGKAAPKAPAAAAIGAAAAAAAKAEAAAEAEAAAVEAAAVEATAVEATAAVAAAEAAAAEAAAAEAAAEAAAAKAAAKAAAAKAAAEAAAAEAAAAEAAAKAAAAKVVAKAPAKAVAITQVKSAQSSVNWVLQDLSMLSLKDDDGDNDDEMDWNGNFLPQTASTPALGTSGPSSASTSTSTRDSLSALALTSASFLDRLPASLLALTTGSAPAHTTATNQTTGSNTRVARAGSQSITPAASIEQVMSTQPKPKARPKMRKAPQVESEPETAEDSAFESNPPVVSGPECDGNGGTAETVKTGKTAKPAMTAKTAEATGTAGPPEAVGEGVRGGRARGGRGGRAKQVGETAAPVEPVTVKGNTKAKALGRGRGKGKGKQA